MPEPLPDPRLSRVLEQLDEERTRRIKAERKAATLQAQFTKLRAQRIAPHWRAEAVGHRDDARRHFSPSMRQRLKVVKLYREAVRRM